MADFTPGSGPSADRQAQATVGGVMKGARAGASGPAAGGARPARTLFVTSAGALMHSGAMKPAAGAREATAGSDGRAKAVEAKDDGAKAHEAPRAPQETKVNRLQRLIKAGCQERAGRIMRCTLFTRRADAEITLRLLHCPPGTPFVSIDWARTDMARLHAGAIRLLHGRLSKAVALLQGHVGSIQALAQVGLIPALLPLVNMYQASVRCAEHVRLPDAVEQDLARGRDEALVDADVVPLFGYRGSLGFERDLPGLPYSTQGDESPPLSFQPSVKPYDTSARLTDMRAQSRVDAHTSHRQHPLEHAIVVRRPGSARMAMRLAFGALCSTEADSQVPHEQRMPWLRLLGLLATGLDCAQADGTVGPQACLIERGINSVSAPVEAAAVFGLGPQAVVAADIRTMHLKGCRGRPCPCDTETDEAGASSVMAIAMEEALTRDTRIKSTMTGSSRSSSTSIAVMVPAVEQQYQALCQLPQSRGDCFGIEQRAIGQLPEALVPSQHKQISHGTMASGSGLIVDSDPELLLHVEPQANLNARPLALEPSLRAAAVAPAAQARVNDALPEFAVQEEADWWSILNWSAPGGAKGLQHLVAGVPLTPTYIGIDPNVPGSNFRMDSTGGRPVLHSGGEGEPPLRFAPAEVYIHSVLGPAKQLLQVLSRAHYSLLGQPLGEAVEAEPVHTPCAELLAQRGKHLVDAAAMVSKFDPPSLAAHRSPGPGSGKAPRPVEAPAWRYEHAKVTTLAHPVAQVSAVGWCYERRLLRLASVVDAVVAEAADEIALMHDVFGPYANPQAPAEVDTVLTAAARDIAAKLDREVGTQAAGSSGSHSFNFAVGDDGLDGCDTGSEHSATTALKHMRSNGLYIHQLLHEKLPALELQVITLGLKRRHQYQWRLQEGQHGQVSQSDLWLAKRRHLASSFWDDSLREATHVALSRELQRDALRPLPADCMTHPTLHGAWARSTFGQHDGDIDDRGPYSTMSPQGFSLQPPHLTDETMTHAGSTLLECQLRFADPRFQAMTLVRDLAVITGAWAGPRTTRINASCSQYGSAAGLGCATSGRGHHTCLKDTYIAPAYEMDREDGGPTRTPGMLSHGQDLQWSAAMHVHVAVQLQSLRRWAERQYANARDHVTARVMREDNEAAPAGRMPADTSNSNNDESERDSQGTPADTVSVGSWDEEDTSARDGRTAPQAMSPQLTAKVAGLPRTPELPLTQPGAPGGSPAQHRGPIAKDSPTNDGPSALQKLARARLAKAQLGMDSYCSDEGSNLGLHGANEMAATSNETKDHGGDEPGVSGPRPDRSAQTGGRPRILPVCEKALMLAAESLEQACKAGSASQGLDAAQSPSDSSLPRVAVAVAFRELPWMVHRLLTNDEETNKLQLLQPLLGTRMLNACVYAALPSLPPFGQSSSGAGAGALASGPGLPQPLPQPTQRSAQELLQLRDRMKSLAVEVNAIQDCMRALGRRPAAILAEAVSANARAGPASSGSPAGGAPGQQAAVPAHVALRRLSKACTDAMRLLQESYTGVRMGIDSESASIAELAGTDQGLARGSSTSGPASAQQAHTPVWEPRELKRLQVARCLLELELEALHAAVECLQERQVTGGAGGPAPGHGLALPSGPAGGLVSATRGSMSEVHEHAGKAFRKLTTELRWHYRHVPPVGAGLLWAARVGVGLDSEDSSAESQDGDSDIDARAEAQQDRRRVYALASRGAGAGSCNGAGPASRLRDDWPPGYPGLAAIVKGAASKQPV